VILPCRHESHITNQVQPTIDLLTNLDVLHPDVLSSHQIEPADYKGSLVFRSAVESIRGRYIASSTTGRERLVAQVLEMLRQREYLADYQQTSGQERHDFELALQHGPDYFVALEVKGGEGNSINISERPLWAKEFAVWSHLDGAVVNQPEHGLHSIINRLANELVRRNKLVDALFLKDELCGTRTRPCPKYPDREDVIGLQAAPDIFLFPQRVPSLDDPDPPVHSLATLRLPTLVLSLFEPDRMRWPTHVWEVHVQVHESSGALRRKVEIYHQGTLVDESISRTWRQRG
jgi:hypothetical protein